MSQLEYYDYILVTLCSGIDLLGVNHLRGIFYITFSEPVARTKERKEGRNKEREGGRNKEEKEEGKKRKKEAEENK